jgi:signal transduction histidine kinase/ActR/RegA family two-component response regulator
VLGQPFNVFVKKEDEETYLQLVHRISTNKETIKNFKGVLLTNDGRERLFDMSGAPNLDSTGEMVGIVGMLKDITEQHQLAQQLLQTSKMNAIGTLTGGISHDFNNILQAISGYNQLMMMKKTSTDPDWKHIRSIHDLTQRAMELVKQLLIFSRKVESTMMPIDMNVEVDQYYNLIVNTLPKTITVYKALASDLHTISGDKSQLGQVIMNLTVNAKDAMPEGGTITLCTENVIVDKPYYRGDAEIQAGQYVRLSISDTGCGMDGETLRRVFEPFFTTKEQGKGTGIGLAVVYGIVKNHKGYIFCSSEPGQGTTFDVYLPKSEAMVSAATGKTDETTKTEATTEHCRYEETILLVDDEQHLLEAGQELLALFGYDVLTASSGEEALTIIKEKRTDISLVILDLMMPVMGGEQCLVEIIKLAPAMKVIVASGYLADVTTRAILHQGAADFIQKPYYFKDLNKKIRALLDSD